jgi:hypothetical protein
MRAREDAARRAARPLLFTQALAIAGLLGLLISIAGRLTLPTYTLIALSPLDGNLPILRLAIAAACCLIVAPVALYFALSRE